MKEDGENDLVQINDVDGRFDSPNDPRDRAAAQNVRRFVAYGLLILIALLSIIILVGVGTCNLSLDAAKDLITALISPLFAIFGAVMGFYFGSSARY